MKDKKPILFLIFNRPETTSRVFETIRKYKPTELFIAADGPRENKLGEKERCEEARKITEKIDWPCKVKRLYRKKNLGCKYAVSGAIDWFFSNVEEGIILEDDCLPNPTFFAFCEQMLTRYRNDINVMHITGDNYQDGVHRGESGSSYYFSKYPHIWGWATWRRAWKKFNVEIRNWDSIGNGLLNLNLEGIWEKLYWNNIFNMVSKGKIDTWDYQWTYACWLNRGKTITPNINLVKNIGFSIYSTHTKRAGRWLAGLNKYTLAFPLKHPKTIEIDKQADGVVAKKFFGANVHNAIYITTNMFRDILSI